MAELEKTIKALQSCSVQNDVGCQLCPYFEDRKTYGHEWCTTVMAQDALELLKPRVLTLDEALGSDDPVYFESNGRMECWVDAYISDDLQCAVFYRFHATEFMLPLSRYKKDWRCWSSPPSYEQSKAVKWE